jgi:hypothetical protein
VTDIDLTAIIETRLKPEFGNCELLPGNDFIIHRKDRIDIICGGTLLAASEEKSLKAKRKFQFVRFV